MRTMQFLSLTLLFFLAACQPAAGSATPVPSEQPTLPPQTGTPAGLSEEALKNAEYIFIEDNQPYLVRLTDGRYQFGSDPTAEDYVAINLADVFAFGDLDGDGVEDAAVLLVETYGGTGVFVSLAAVLDQDGTPKHISTAFIDDRPVIFTLAIENGEILMNVVVHAPDDAMCCPTLAQTRTYRLGPRGLVLTQLTSQFETGGKRVITIDAPLKGAEVGRTFTLAGGITIAPFENNLVVKVFDAAEKQVYIGPLAVTAAEMGAPGTFETIISLDGVEAAPGPLRIEVVDVNMADGSNLAVASVDVILK